MADISFDINHDVLVMTILNLQNVANERIGSQRIGKILNGLLLPLSALLAKLLVEIVSECCKAVFSAKLLLNR